MTVFDAGDVEGRVRESGGSTEHSQMCTTTLASAGSH